MSFVFGIEYLIESLLETFCIHDVEMIQGVSKPFGLIKDIKVPK